MQFWRESGPLKEGITQSLRPLVMAVIGRRPMMIHAPGILRICISVVTCLPAILIREEFLDLPSVGLDPDGKLEIFFRNVVPELDRGACQKPCRVLVFWNNDGNTYLVHHHDRQEVTERGEEKTVHVMLHAIADGVTECVKEHLTTDEDHKTKSDVTERPAVLKGVHYQ